MNAIRRIRLPGTNKYGIMMNGEIIEPEDDNSFDVFTEVFKLIQVKDLPRGECFNVIDFEEEYRASNKGFESLELYFLRKKYKQCRIKFFIYYDPGLWNLKITIDQFLKLKKGLIHKYQKMKPVIEIEDIQNNILNYSVEIRGNSVDEVIRAANDYDEKITTEIINRIGWMSENQRRISELDEPFDLSKSVYENSF
jgi:hypothetical protein